jgi:FkbM family methyltransferase
MRPGDVALDIGASWGHYTWAMARLAGGSGRVHAFEPNPANRRQLELIALRRRNVIVHPFGLSDARGTAELHVPVQAGCAVTELGSLGHIDSQTVTVRVRVERLDDVIDLDERVAFVKCDVEGHERRVLAGGARLLERCRPILLVEIERRHPQADVRGTVHWLESLGYSAQMVLPEGLTPAARFDDEIHQPAAGPGTEGYVGDFVFLPPTR